MILLRSRILRRFWADVLLRCPKCGKSPLEVTMTQANRTTRHRFECPECPSCNAAWHESHAKAALEWNQKAAKK